MGKQLSSLSVIIWKNCNKIDPGVPPDAAHTIFYWQRVQIYV